MKKIISIILVVASMFTFYNQAYAACSLGAQGWINGSWTVPGNCTFPVGPHFINGDVTVGTRVVTVPNNSMIVIDLSSNKITFTTGKILLEGNAVIKYVDSVYYSTAAPAITPCPSGMTAYDPNSLANAPGSLTSNNAIPTGRVYCK